jgi:hypothetical protein
MRASITRYAAGCAAALLALLAGCGGGSESPRSSTQFVPPPPPSPPPTCDSPPEGIMASLPKGVFGGTLEGHPDDNFILVSRFDPHYGAERGLMIRGADLLSAPPRVSSVTGFVREGSCLSSDLGIVNGYEGLFGATEHWDDVYVNVTLDPLAPTVSGTLRYVAGTKATHRLSGGPVAGTNYDPKASPVLADISGDWSMTNADGHAVQLSVASDGKIVGSIQGCALTGTLQADADGLNLFSVGLRFATPPCPAYHYTEWASVSISGFALVLPVTGASPQLLLWAEADNGWGPMDFILAVGRR